MRRKLKVKIFIFDLGGVLIHGGYLDFVNHYCAACLTPAGQKKILDLEKQVNLGVITEEKFYRAIHLIFGVHLTPKAMHRIIMDKSKKDKTLLDLVRKLGRKRVAMFTNSIGSMALQAMRIENISARRLFKKVFISTNMHLVKPDPRAYRFILKKLKIKPSEAVMVDDRGVNVQGAKKVGMHGILYKSASQFRRELKKYEFS